MKDTNSKEHFFIGEPLPHLPDAIIARGVVKNYPEGSMISPERSEVEGVFYVQSGVVRVLRPSISGPRRTLFIVSSGHFFFEAHYFRARRLFSQAEVVAEAHLVFFPCKTVRELLASSENFRDQIFQSLSCKALIMGTELMEGAYSNPQEHILQILVKLPATATPAGSEIKITQDELAELAGLHRVSVNRTLRRLEDEGRIKLMRGRIVVAESPL
ncbi:Crp/Fnr family transcriptional regulator [Desulfovibrio sp. OttesenSCG-928-C14]|nr:Crp/Fnr family transcriptional regulator [Desulfovibrio sp. OttesenSCG-928-C14]